MFCYLRYQSLVSVATSMGFKQLRGRVWRVARSWGALGKGAACSHGESWRTECWITLGRVGEGRVVFMAVGKNRDIQKLSCSSPVSQRRDGKRVVSMVTAGGGRHYLHGCD